MLNEQKEEENIYLHNLMESPLKKLHFRFISSQRYPFNYKGTVSVISSDLPCVRRVQR